jgi:hypothetical protein
MNGLFFGSAHRPYQTAEGAHILYEGEGLLHRR